MSSRNEALKEMMAAMRRKGLVITDAQAAAMIKAAEQAPQIGAIDPKGYDELVARLRKL